MKCILRIRNRIGHMKKDICVNVHLDLFQCRGHLAIDKKLLKLNEENQTTIEIYKGCFVAYAFIAYLSMMLQQEVGTESFQVPSVSSESEVAICMADSKCEVTESNQKDEGGFTKNIDLIKNEQLEESDKIKNNFLNNQTDVEGIAKNNFRIPQIEAVNIVSEKNVSHSELISENNTEIEEKCEPSEPEQTNLLSKSSCLDQLETASKDFGICHQDETDDFEESEFENSTTAPLPENNDMGEENELNDNNESVPLMEPCSADIECDSEWTEKITLKNDSDEAMKTLNSQALSIHSGSENPDEKHLKHNEGVDLAKNLSSETMDLQTPEKESSEPQSTPLKSVLKKSGTPKSKKGLRVSFSDSQIVFIEPEPSSSMTLFLGQGFELHLSDLCQWEAALQFPTSHSDPFEGSWEDMSNSLSQADSTTDKITTPAIEESNIQESNSIPEMPNHQAAENKSATCPELTEANLRHHEQLLDFKNDQNTESDTETSSSQDTMILMTTEESRRNQEHIEESQRRYEMQQQGSSSSSSHESDETSTKTVMRSNSAVRRCLERTALRRSLTRCSEARLRLQEVSKREDSGSSVAEKLRLLTQELETDTQKGLEGNCEVQNKSKDVLPCLDLNEVQTLLTRHCSLNDMYSFQNDVNVPCDIREWKLHSYLEDCHPEKEFKSKTTNSRSYMTNLSDSLPDMGFEKPSSLEVDPHSIPSEVPLNVNDSDELAQFVQQDKDRIDRIRRRYSSDSEDYVSLGFSRRPSVRGIRPKFGSTNQILQQLQQQLQPPSLARSPGSHVTWPYMNVDDSSVPDNSIYSLHLPSAAQENKKFNYLSSIRPHSVIGNYSASPNMSFDGNFNSDVNTNYNVSDHRNSTYHDMEALHSSRPNNTRLLNSDPSMKTYPMSRTKRRKERFQANCSVSPSSYTASSLPEHHPSPPPYIPPPNPSAISIRTCERGTPEGASSSPKVSSDSLYILSPNITVAPEKQTKDGLVYFALDV